YYTSFFFFFQAEDGIRDFHVTGVQTCALPILDIGGRHVGRRAVDAFDPEAQGADDLVEAVAAVHEGPGDVLAEQAVGQEQAADDRQCPAHHAAGGLEDQHDEIGRASCRARVEAS